MKLSPPLHLLPRLPSLVLYFSSPKADKVRSDGETSDARSGSDKDSSEKPEPARGTKSGQITAPGEPAVLPPRAFLPGNSEQSGAEWSRGGACQ